MDIHPQDLGWDTYKSALHLRLGGAHLDTYLKRKNPTWNSLGLLRRLWLRGSPVPAEIAASVPMTFHHCGLKIWSGPASLPPTLFMSGVAILVLESSIFGIWNVPHSLDWLYGSWLAAGSAEVYYAVAVQPRRKFRLLHGPLTEEEVKKLKSRADDPLGHDFLSFVEELLPIPAAVGTEAGADLRRTLSALGKAIEDLPQAAPKPAQSDPHQMQKQTALLQMALLQQAATLREMGQQETDRVIAASLERQAQSFTYRSELLAGTEVLNRRNETLREEVSEQIEALRTTIPALRAGGYWGVQNLASLAASIHRIALGASAAAMAHAEVDTLLSQPLTGLSQPLTGFGNFGTSE